MINRVVLVGRLTRDPELKRTASGSSFALFTVAVDNRTKNPDGTKTTTFVSCVAFQQTADLMVRYTRKGALIGVEGRLNQRTFQRQDGTKGSAIEVLCDNVQFLEPKSDRAEEAETPVFDDTPADSVDSRNLDTLDLPDDDLPF